VKLLVLNPFGTDKFDKVIKRTLDIVKRPDTEFAVEHLPKGPEYYRFWYFKTLAEVDVIERIIEAESEGYDGVYVACAYEPGVKSAREVVDIPVVGATVPTVYLACQLGHRFGYISDTRLALVNTWDIFRKYRLHVNCVAMESIELGIEDIASNPEENVKRVMTIARKIIQKGAEVIILGCTVVAAFFTDNVGRIKFPSELARITFLDSNICAFKTLELLVDLSHKAGIKFSRYAYYASPRQVCPSDFIKYRRLYNLEEKIGKQREIVNTANLCFNFGETERGNG